jgi:tRNA 2-thiouridine synthesizing protein A
VFAPDLYVGARTGAGDGHDGGCEGVGMTGRRRSLFGRGAVRDPADRTDSVPYAAAERPVVTAPGPVTALTIDALGRKCPIPIIMLAEQIRDIPLGAVVAVLADDPAAYTDIPSWCAMKAQEFVHSIELPRGGWALYIRRRL